MERSNSSGYSRRRDHQRRCGGGAVVFVAVESLPGYYDDEHAEERDDAAFSWTEADRIVDNQRIMDRLPEHVRARARGVWWDFQGCNTAAVEYTEIEGAVFDDTYVVGSAERGLYIAFVEVFGTASGWPLCSMCGEHWRVDENEWIEWGIRTPHEPEDWLWFLGWPRLIPLKLLWPGFAINTILYAAIVWGLFAAPFAIRKRVRLKRGQCTACGYSLRGRESGSDKCLECGTVNRFNTEDHREPRR